ncbi:MAG: hypothetical protein AB1631_04530 [Acidobacteriota bacterium]
MSSLKDVLEANREKILKIPGVVGVALGISPTRPGERCILVYIDTETRPPALPPVIEGYSVEAVKTGKGFRPL